MLLNICVTSYVTQTCWFSSCVPSVSVHVKDLKSLNHHADCKIMPPSCNLLFIAWQIVYNGLMTVWATGNHLNWEGAHTHCKADTQVNGNSHWHCHGKCLSRCPGLVPYGWIWLGRKKKSPTSGSVDDQKHRYGASKTCCNLVDQMFALCVSAR